MSDGGEAIVVPVGMSPVHSFRILKSLVDRDFRMIILAVSDQTRATGQTILDVFGDGDAETKLTRYDNIAKLVERNSGIEQWNLQQIKNMVWTMLLRQFMTTKFLGKTALIITS